MGAIYVGVLVSLHLDRYTDSYNSTVGGGDPYHTRSYSRGARHRR